MLRSFTKYSLLCILGLVLHFSAFAEVRVTASLDSASILMGRIDTLRLIVERDAAQQGAFPIFNKKVGKGFTTLLGDTIELGSPRIDTVNNSSGRITERFRVPVQVFDSGFYRLPPFVYLTANDSVLSNQVELNVVPVVVGENDAISDFNDIVDPSDKSFWDFIPDWLYDLWWLWLLIICAIPATIYFARKYRKTGKFITLPEKPQPKPWEIALERLETLKSKNLWEQGMEKEYFTDLTDILRDYLDARFGINAMEMTSRQIMQTLADQENVREKRGYVRKILDIADFVKFAKVRPLPEDNVAAYDNAVNFVKETIEHPVPEKASDDSVSSDAVVHPANIEKGGER